ncbi:hypothetical protein [Methylocystis heyeri]|uniref:hypothetical protein n=1 Tax=Methylocystis heyeri TaxID=391905 RepID=UPI001138E4F9
MRREYLEGREEGQKDRPCAIVAAIRADESGNTRVLVLPITHSAPDHASLAVEIPAKVKQRLQLDEAQSWVVLSEWNEFVWPGPDLRRLPNADDATVAYGMLPPGLFATIRDRFLALVNSGATSPVRRT